MKVKIKSEEEIWKTLIGCTIKRIKNDITFEDGTCKMPFNLNMFKYCDGEYDIDDDCIVCTGCIMIDSWMWISAWYTVIEPVTDWVSADLSPLPNVHIVQRSDGSKVTFTGLDHWEVVKEDDEKISVVAVLNDGTFDEDGVFVFLKEWCTLVRLPDDTSPSKGSQEKAQDEFFPNIHKDILFGVTNIPKVGENPVKGLKMSLFPIKK
jgi:hypothetical protein